MYALRKVSHNLKFITCKIKDQWSSYQKDMIVKQSMPKEIFDNAFKRTPNISSECSVNIEDSRDSKNEAQTFAVYSSLRL